MSQEEVISQLNKELNAARARIEELESAIAELVAEIEKCRNLLEEE